jgi:hypothetical protein
MEVPNAIALVLVSGLLAPALAPGASAATRQEGTTQAASSDPKAKTPDERLAEIVERYQADQQEIYQAYSQATTDEERQAILADLPGPEYVPEFRALAEEVQGTEAAARAWIWVLRLSMEKDKATALATLDTLTSAYLISPALDELPGELRYAAYYLGGEPIERALRGLIAGSPVRGVQASALFTLGAIFVEGQDVAKKSEGRAFLERIVKDYADVPYWRSTFGKAAGGFLFELDHLQIGMAAPDFEAVDEGGTPWKLSEYRGKVVVVDFWGFW